MERLTILLADGTVCYADENITLVPAELSVGQTRRILHQLNKYEATGLTPNEITTLKKTANTKAKCQRTIVGIPKAKKIKQKVSRYGLYIKGKKYYLSDLSTYHFGETVDVIINEQSKHVKVFINDMLVEEFDL